MANVMNGSEKVTVRALFKFKASNNDEVIIWLLLLKITLKNILDFLNFFIFYSLV